MLSGAISFEYPVSGCLREYFAVQNIRNRRLSYTPFAINNTMMAPLKDGFNEVLDDPGPPSE
jgi:hypothetical protein